jgi:hypothetical protein
MELSRLTGHKSLEVLNRRYFDIQVDELYALLLEKSGNVRLNRPGYCGGWLV